MALFGLNGFVIGPLIAALFMASWDLFSPPDEEVIEPIEPRPPVPADDDPSAKTR